MIYKTIKSIAILFALCISLTSCYTYTAVVGEGAQGNKETTEWNHYLIYGLAPVGVSDPAEVAKGATDYNVEVKHSFVNGLVAALTFGIYTPTTTTIIE